METSHSIFPPHKIFYFESILSITTSAMKSVEDFSDIHTAMTKGEEYSLDELFYAIQNMISQSAALSRYFWPSQSRDQRSASRAADLKASLNISEDSLLKDRRVRNSVEHFDERLDAFSATAPNGYIYPKKVSYRNEPLDPLHIFLGYHPDRMSFSVLGDELDLKRLIKELITLHGDVMEQVNA